jgi:hypothetical protein
MLPPRDKRAEAKAELARGCCYPHELRPNISGGGNLGLMV